MPFDFCLLCVAIRSLSLVMRCLLKCLVFVLCYVLVMYLLVGLCSFVCDIRVLLVFAVGGCCLLVSA